MKYIDFLNFPIRDDEEIEEEKSEENTKVKDDNHTFDDVLTDEEFDDLMD